MKGSLILEFGSYAGFYLAKGDKGWTLCLGWIALSYWSLEIHRALALVLRAAKAENNDLKEMVDGEDFQKKGGAFNE